MGSDETLAVATGMPEPPGAETSVLQPANPMAAAARTGRRRTPVMSRAIIAPRSSPTCAERLSCHVAGTRHLARARGLSSRHEGLRRHGARLLARGMDGHVEWWRRHEPPGTDPRGTRDPRAVRGWTVGRDARARGRWGAPPRPELVGVRAGTEDLAPDLGGRPGRLPGARGRLGGRLLRARPGCARARRARAAADGVPRHRAGSLPMDVGAQPRRWRDVDDGLGDRLPPNGFRGSCPGLDPDEHLAVDDHEPSVGVGAPLPPGCGDALEVLAGRKAFLPGLQREVRRGGATRPAAGPPLAVGG